MPSQILLIYVVQVLVTFKFSPEHTAKKFQTCVKHCVVRFEVNLAHKGILLFMTDVVVPKSKRVISHCSHLFTSHCSHLGNIG